MKHVKSKMKIQLNNKILLNNLTVTNEFSYSLAKIAMPSDIFCLIGDLGAGKTIIAKGFGKFFNVNEEITSPTFTIYKNYTTGNDKILRLHHFDLYRIKSVNELEDIGFFEAINDESAITLIEWPEVALKLLNRKHYIVNLYKNDNEFERIVSVSINEK